MRHAIAMLTMGCLLLGLVGCSYVSTGTNLGEAASAAGMKNITTGDGTFENYTAVDHNATWEIGIGVGIPFLCKIMELYPVQSNEEQMTRLAKESKAAGADAMINVTPPSERYTGFPFFIVGLYIDRAEGTGIKTR